MRPFSPSLIYRLACESSPRWQVTYAAGFFTYLVYLDQSLHLSIPAIVFRAMSTDKAPKETVAARHALT